MAESEDKPIELAENDGDTAQYTSPAEKSIKEILSTDDDDESLRKYKEQLLGNVTVFFPNDERKVLLQKMSILVEGRPDKEINLEDKDQLKNMKFIVKEGAKYRLMITFHVQHEIVAGLRFVNEVCRGPLNVDKTTHMVGSFGPREKVYEFKSPEEEFPSGLLLRGEYKVKSIFTDDDKNVLLAWKWSFEIKKDWKD